MSYSTIRLEAGANGVTTLTLDRPETLNALTPTMLDEIGAAVRAAPTAGARCLLITGAGRGFSSGADLASDGGLPDDLGLALEEHFNPMIEAMFDCPIPIVAAVNGAAAGAGCSIALAADIVVAAGSAYFLQAFINIGLIPDSGATWLLPRLAGRARALEMMMLGERVPAAQAVEWGMISRVVEDEALMAEAGALAERFAKGPTAAFAELRKLTRNAEHLSITEALAAERVAQREAGRTEDFKGAVMAFLQKQKPSFNGR